MTIQFGSFSLSYSLCFMLLLMNNLEYKNVSTVAKNGNVYASRMKVL